MLLERHGHHHRNENLRAGLVAAAVFNSQGGIDGRAVSPQEMIGEEEPLRDINELIGQLELEGAHLTRNGKRVEC